jgi:hypothetical protein
MAVYKSSRLTGTKIYIDEDLNIPYLAQPNEKFSAKMTDMEIAFRAGMRVDLLAKEYYGDAQLDWVIMQANPRFFTPEDIQPGDYIVIPSPKRVMGNV